jgi:hypothetical protein
MVSTETAGNTLSIWRYMDLARFVSMLNNGALWFAKAATFRDDPFEGFCKAVHADIPPAGDDQLCVQEQSNDGHAFISVGQMITELSSYASRICENARDHLYVNSWCVGDCESMAMWQIYGRQNGVAVKSSTDRFCRAARFDVRPEQYDFGEVKYHEHIEDALEVYRDFRNRPIPLSSGLWHEVLELGFHKRSVYRFENEWRAAVYQDRRPEIAGIYIEFDIRDLIEEVYIDPWSADFFFDVVSSVLAKFDIQKRLQQSGLLCTPALHKGRPLEVKPNQPASIDKWAFRCHSFSCHVILEARIPLRDNLL